MTQIRLSPSGPVIQNLNGSSLAVTGPGLQLRLAEASTPIGTHGPVSSTPVDIGQTPGGDPLIAELASPTAGYFYRAEVHVDVENAIAGLTRGEVTIQASYDAGATWNPVSTTGFEVQEGGYRPTRAFLKMTTLDIPEGAQSIQIKGTMRVPQGSIFFSSVNSGTGSAHIVLTELF